MLTLNLAQKLTERNAHAQLCARANMLMRACSRPTLCACNHAHSHAQAQLCARAIMPTLLLTLNPAHGETYRAPRIRPTLRACNHAHAHAHAQLCARANATNRSAALHIHGTAGRCLCTMTFCRGFLCCLSFSSGSGSGSFYVAPFELVRVSSAGRVPFPPSPPSFSLQSPAVLPPPLPASQASAQVCYCSNLPLSPPHLIPTYLFPSTS